MRRRKTGRGRPKKVKKGRLGKLRNTIVYDSKLSVDALEDQTTTLKSDDAVTAAFIGLDKTGPYSYRVGSVNIELEGSEEDIKPVIQENDIMLEVSCGSNTASMFLSKLCQGSKGSCIEFDGAWLTPNEFQFVSGRETAKDWKRSIRHFGRSLKLLINKGILTVHPAACRCDSCRLLSATTNEPKLVAEKRALSEKMKGGSEESASGSDKDGRGSDEDEAEDGSEENGESQDETENGEDESGSEEGEEEVEEGKVEENNNEAGEKESSSSSDSSSSSGSSDSDPDSDDEDDKKDEDDDEEEETAGSESKPEVVPVVSLPEPIVSKPSPVESPVEATKAADFAEEGMEVDCSEEQDETKDLGTATESENKPDESETIPVSGTDTPEDVIENEFHESDDEPLAKGIIHDDDNIKEDVQNEQSMFDEQSESQQDTFPEQECIKNQIENFIANDSNDQNSNEQPIQPEVQPTQESFSKESEGPNSDSEIPQDVVPAEPAIQEESGNEDNSMDALVIDEQKVESPENHDRPELSIPQDMSQDSSNTSNISSIPQRDESPKLEQSPVPSRVVTPLMADNPFKKSVERSNSSGGGGKSRLSNIIDLLRTSKEKETKKQGVPDRPEEERPEKRVPEVKEMKTPSPVPVKREEVAEVKQRKPEKEESNQTRYEAKLAEAKMTEAKMAEKAREAMWFPMGRLPFGFPPPDLLERASREAHEQLSKSHRQFEKNLESLMAQNMNPFIPELSIYSLPEHRAQMEYTYLKNMERLDQMAKERMQSMAEMRHHQLLREHNKYVAKLAEHHQKGGSKRENERPREHSKKTVPSQKRKEDSPQAQAKVPHAHGARPEPRKDKPDQRALQTPPAAHHHQPTSRPPSAGSKPPSSLPLPASSSRAAHPSPSATQSRSSPMIAPIAPPLQMWSSCFPNVIPPPTMEMQRLTQFFPNLNGGLFPTVPNTTRQTESPILDLSTKKRKMQAEARDHESRSKEPRLSSSGKSVQSLHANGLPRDGSHPRSHSNKDSKERQMWPGLDRAGALTCTCALQHLNDIRTWSVDDVCCFLKGLEGCTLYVEAFRRNQVDGHTLILLTADTLVNSLGMKPGAAKFLTDSVAKRARDLQKLVPCEFCRMKIQKG